MVIVLMIGCSMMVVDVASGDSICWVTGGGPNDAATLADCDAGAIDPVRSVKSVAIQAAMACISGGEDATGLILDAAEIADHLIVILFAHCTLVQKLFQRLGIDEPTARSAHAVENTLAQEAADVIGGAAGALRCGAGE